MSDASVPPQKHILARDPLKLGVAVFSEKSTECIHFAAPASGGLSACQGQ
jgi:hypothetical protein